MKITIIIFLILVCLFIFACFYKPLGQGIFKSKKDYSNITPMFYKGKFHIKEPVHLMSAKKSDYNGKRRRPKNKIPVKKIQSIHKIKKDDILYSWFGHSTSFLQMQELNILIDPVFSQYSSPVQFIGPKRFSEPPIKIEQLPHIDIVVISHDHYDHMDYVTLKKLNPKVSKFIVPLGLEQHLLRWGIDKDKIIALSWWQEINIEGLTIILTPTRHFSGRVPWLSNTTLFGGFIFKNNNFKVYYTGDTGYGSHFKEIYEKYGEIDLLILENGQYDNQWPEVHLHPHQGIQVIEDVHAKATIPIHWGTFSICVHPWDESIKQITTLASQKDFNIITPYIGELVQYSHIQDYKNHWWEEVSS